MEIKKSLAFEDEARISCSLLKDGFTNYAKISESNEHYDTPLYLIGGGLEKLSKLIILLSTYDYENKKFLSVNELKNQIGHDLVRAKAELIKCYEDYSCRSNSLDEDFVRDDNNLDKALTLLSEFMQGGRFDNLNTIASSGKEETTVAQWQTFTEGLIGSEISSIEVEYSQINEKILALLVRYVRSLVKLVYFDCLPESVNAEAQSLFSHFKEFLQIEDSQLGVYFANCATVNTESH